MQRIVYLSLLMGLLGTSFVLAQNAKPPKDIPSTFLAETWPQLKSCLDDWDNGDDRSALACAGDLIHQGDSVDAAWHLKAQILRNQKKFDEAIEAIEKAIDLQPEHHLHPYQLGLIAKYRVQNISNPMKKWKWSTKAYEAHEKALSLKPDEFVYRRYIVMHKLQAPAIAGGDKEEALAITEAGVKLGVKRCLYLRAYCHLKMDNDEAAFADLDASMELDYFSYLIFKAGGDRAAALKDDARARKYYNYMTKHIADHPISFYILGDYLYKTKDMEGAEQAFAKVVSLQPDYVDAGKKLAKIRGSKP